jgi:hypothetical protein
MKRTSVVMLLLGVAALVTAPAVAQTVVDENFDNYTLGPIAGQGGWTTTVQERGASAQVVDDPLNPGNKVLRLQNFNGTHGSNTSGTVRTRLTNLNIDGPALVEWSYDFQYAENKGPGGGSGTITVRLLDAHYANGTWIGTQCYDGGNDIVASQYWASYNRDQDGGLNWDHPGGPTFPVGNTRRNIKWVYYNSGAGDNRVILIKKVATNPPEEILTPNSYTNFAFGQADTDLDIMDFRIFGDDDGTGANGKETTLYIDNVKIVVTPGAGPIANANGPYTGPGGYDGAQVNVTGAGSTGAITKYEWVTPYTTPIITLSSGSAVAQTLALANNTSVNLMLNTYLANGVYDTAKTTATTGAPTPIPTDDFQADYSALFGDKFGRANSAAPVQVSATRDFQLLARKDMINDPYNATPGGVGPGFHWNLDINGNGYYLAWYGRMKSIAPDMSLRWTGKDGATEVPMTGGPLENNTVLVGKRFVYIVGADDLGIPMVWAFEKAGGALKWSVDLVTTPGGTTVVEPTNYRPKVTLYNNRIYVLGAIGAELGGAVRVYVVDTGDDDPAGPNTDTGYLVTSTLVELNALAGGTDRGNPGNLVIVPDAFGAGQHGLYFNHASGNDTWADMFGIKVDGTTGVATAAWGPTTLLDGPYLFRSHVLYSAKSGILYTPSYNDWGTSLYAWKPNAIDGAQLVGQVASVDGGNHGHSDVSVIDDSGANVKIISHSNGGELVVYTDVNNDGTAFTVEKYNFEGIGYNFMPHGVLQTASNGHKILVTGTRGEGDAYAGWTVPPKIVALDLSVPPTGGFDTPMASFNLLYDGDMPWGQTDILTVGKDGSVYTFQGKANEYSYRMLRLGNLTPAGMKGDMNCDGVVDFKDINPFVAILSGATPCNAANADTNCDNVIDFKDINPFVALLSGGTPCQ